MKNKSYFQPPPYNQILCRKPKELYIIDITEVPYEFNNSNFDKIYSLSIIDNFAKYAYNYNLKNKTSKLVISKVKLIINKYL